MDEWIKYKNKQEKEPKVEENEVDIHKWETPRNGPPGASEIGRQDTRENITETHSRRSGSGSGHRRQRSSSTGSDKKEKKKKKEKKEVQSPRDKKNKPIITKDSPKSRSMELLAQLNLKLGEDAVPCRHL